MPNPNSTLIVVLLDESGSMGGLTGETLSGLNGFIDQQRRLPGDARLHLVKFNDYARVAVNFKPLNEIKTLSYPNDYSPHGWTALLDAMGETIDEVGHKLADMDEAERPGKVIFVVQTDGHENSSRIFNFEAIQSKVKHQTDVYNWNFVYLGAGQDAIAEASKFGISGAFAATYSASSVGTSKLFTSMGTKIGAYRTTGDTTLLSYNSAERKDLLDDSKVDTKVSTSNS